MSTSQRPLVDTGGSGAEALNEDKAGQRPPLPSTSAPLAIACSCLNVTIAARVPDDLKERLDSAPRDALEPVWLPRDAETIVRILATGVTNDRCIARCLRFCMRVKTQTGRRHGGNAGCVTSRFIARQIRRSQIWRLQSVGSRWISTRVLS